MLNVHTFTFNAYQENTYLVYDELGNCAIFDPGMSSPQEEAQLAQYISSHQLHPQLLVNTHCHIDHVLGNQFIYDTYGLTPQMHELEVPLLVAVSTYAPLRGFRYEGSPIPETFLPEKGTIRFADNSLHILFAPGHSPGHLCFYAPEEGFIIAGDVLFHRSIGRTDLPGGNHQQLLDSIARQIYTLPDSVRIYPGHGPYTSIGEEKAENPYIRA